MVKYHSLAAVAHRWLGQVLDKSEQTSDWSGPLTDEQIAYAAQDAAILLPLHDALHAALAEAGLTAVAALEFAALPAVVWMEAAGVPIDVAAWTACETTPRPLLATLDAELATVLPGVNVNSHAAAESRPRQPRHHCPRTRKRRRCVRWSTSIRPSRWSSGAKRRRSGSRPTATAYLEACRTRRPAASTPSYRLIGAASGRMACSEPNMQNVPRDPAYRRCIRPAPGRVFVKADYSQIELRIAAQISGDTAMQAAFRAGEDLHTKTARAVLGREPTTNDRQLAKALNFGLLYGMGAERLRTYAHDDYGVPLSEAEAIQFRQRFFQAYPGLRAWHRAQREGEITTHTLAGRPRHGVSQFTEKLNSPVQGTGADILKGALARLWADRASVPSAVPVLVVHDEIVIELDAEDAERGVAWIIDHMTAAGAEALPDVPIEVEAQIVADWSGTTPGQRRSDMRGERMTA